MKQSFSTLELKDWSLIRPTGRGATKRKGGGDKFYNPTKRGGGGVGHAEGGHNKFWGSFYTVA